MRSPERITKLIITRALRLLPFRLASQAQVWVLALDRYVQELLAAQALESEPERGTLATEAVVEIRQLRQGLRLDGLDIKHLISEGRRV